MWQLLRLFNFLLAFERIDGNGATNRYLHRWRLFALPFGIRVYLHRFIGDDWARDMHDHPKSFLSIGLWGGYVEDTPWGREVFRAPWIRRFPATHIHRLALGPFHSCWTLVITGYATREWGFYTPSRWVPWAEYVDDEGGAPGA